MDEEFAKEMDNISNKDEFIKIPPIDTPTKEAQLEELEPKESKKETKEDDDDIELLYVSFFCYYNLLLRKNIKFNQCFLCTFQYTYNN